MVLRKLGILPAGGAEISADVEVIYEAIDLRLKEMHRLGTFWRKVDKVPATFSASAGTISAHVGVTDILFPIQMTIRDTSMDEPVDIIGIREYASIKDKNDTGLPIKAPWKGSDEFLFWPIPISASTVKIVYEKIADDTAHGSAPDVEVSMLRWMKDIIAYDVGDDFGASDQKMLRVKAESDIAERNIRKLNAEHKDYSTVAVDDWRGPSTDGWRSDYGR